jgi:hypothetical protein
MEFEPAFLTEYRRLADPIRVVTHKSVRSALTGLRVSMLKRPA